MKVLCIDDRFLLTRGKYYDVIEERIGVYIINNNGHEQMWYKSRFKPVAEDRDDKIDKLLN